MKFYPSDWRSDPRLRLCSIGARGLWIEMISLMHEAEPYGHLLVNGKVISNKQLGSLVGCSADEATTLLLELEQEGVYSITLDGIIYSRRMVRDFEKAKRDKENGGKGGNPSLNPPDKDGVNPHDNGGDKAQKPEARYQNPDSKNSSDLEFEEFWKVYPKRKGSNRKSPALKAFNSAVKAGTDPQIIVSAARKFAEGEATNVGTPFIPMAATWLNQKGWEEHLPDPADEERWRKNVEYMAEHGYQWLDGKWQKPGEAA